MEIKPKMWQSINVQILLESACSMRRVFFLKISEHEKVTRWPMATVCAEKESDTHTHTHSTTLYISISY